MLLIFTTKKQYAKIPFIGWRFFFGNKLCIYFKAFLSVSKESLWILENPKLHISMRVGTPAELSVSQYGKVIAKSKVRLKEIQL